MYPGRTVSGFFTPTSSPGHCERLPSVTAPGKLFAVTLLNRALSEGDPVDVPPQIQEGKMNNYMSKCQSCHSVAGTDLRPTPWIWRPTLEHPGRWRRGGSAVPPGVVSCCLSPLSLSTYSSPHQQKCSKLLTLLDPKTHLISYPSGNVQTSFPNPQGPGCGFVVLVVRWCIFINLGHSTLATVRLLS